MDFLSKSKENKNNQFVGGNVAASSDIAVEPKQPIKPASAGGFFDTAKSIVSDALDKATASLKALFAPGTGSGQDWYKVFPYQIVVARYSATPSFRDDILSFTPNIGLGGDFVAKNVSVKKIDKSFVYTLPIPPESLLINMISASEATPTLGGVIEETSSSVFWDIQLTGTTGIAIGYGENSNSLGMADSFRSTLTTTGLLADAKSRLARAVGGIGTMVDAGIDAVQDVVANADSAQGISTAIFGGLANITNAAALPKLPYFSSAVSGETNGFTTIKELQSIFFKYAANKEAQPELYDLFFVNQKDDQVYQVILKGGLQVQKSARDPYLYRYTFALKAWNKTTLSDSVFNLKKREVNRYKSDLATVNTLNLPQLGQQMANIQANAISHPTKLIGV